MVESEPSSSTAAGSEGYPDPHTHLIPEGRLRALGLSPDQLFFGSSSQETSNESTKNNHFSFVHTGLLFLGAACRDVRSRAKGRRRKGEYDL